MEFRSISKQNMSVWGTLNFDIVRRSAFLKLLTIYLNCGYSLKFDINISIEFN